MYRVPSFCLRIRPGIKRNALHGQEPASDFICCLKMDAASYIYTVQVAIQQIHIDHYVVNIYIYTTTTTQCKLQYVH